MSEELATATDELHNEIITETDELHNELIEATETLHKDILRTLPNGTILPWVMKPSKEASEIAPLPSGN